MHSIDIIHIIHIVALYSLPQAMLALLEVQDFELVRFRAQFSPSSMQKFGSLMEFPPEEVKKNRDEIVKLSERIQLLEKHCRDSITQVTMGISFPLLLHLFSSLVLLSTLSSLQSSHLYCPSL